MSRPSDEEVAMPTHIEFDFHTTATPDQVVEMLTDFSDARPDRWPALSRRFYEVYSLGASEAEVREGQDRPTLWAREHYDWSTPGTVTWTVVESSDLEAGSFVSLTARPGSGGGADVHGVWERTGTTAKGRLILTLMRFAGPRIMRGYFTKAFDGLKPA
jgi:hypothetical protein